MSFQKGHGKQLLKSMSRDDNQVPAVQKEWGSWQAKQETFDMS